MTPAHTDTPLRRSEAGIFRDSAASGMNVTINDDDEERREARRRTLLQSRDSNSPSTFEENETLKKCLEIYNSNKLSRENAWSLSLIDTLTTLLDRHHKSLNNFKVAGSSLEASSKVYSLRVDSIHIDVLRMSAGLSARKFNEQQARGGDDDDDDAMVNTDPNRTQTNNADDANGSEGRAAATVANKKSKRQRKAISTITKNKETLNARLDTVPLQDPVFGKLNSIVGSINSSNRLMNNILLTTESELRLRTNFPFWDSSTLPDCDFTEDFVCNESESEVAACDRLFKLANCENLQLRPVHAGYIITDTPEIITDEAQRHHESSDSNNSGRGDGFNENFCRTAEMSMAFDIDAECEQLPPNGVGSVAPILDVDYADLEELTTEERTAINNCRGLRKAPVLIEDLRPVDANSKLEYSYRPLDKISQFWAGPSHWKFKKSRARSTMFSQQVLGGTVRENGRNNQRGKRAVTLLAKQRAKQLNFIEYHDDLFLKLDDKYKTRKANVHKKWDQRKLKLPTDLQIDPMIFFKYTYAPQLSVIMQTDDQTSQVAPGAFDTDDEGAMDGLPEPFGENIDDVEEGGVNFMNVSSVCVNGNVMNDVDAMDASELPPGTDDVNACNDTILEIATNFEGAPSQVTKIIVPFAKRAKVIDMKNLKRCCSQLLSKQIKRPVQEEQLPTHPFTKSETYAPGIASFRDIYNQLPSLLTQSMTEALSPSVAFYSVLHLANDLSLRLIPEDDLEDFKLRQVIL